MVSQSPQVLRNDGASLSHFPVAKQRRYCNTAISRPFLSHTSGSSEPNVSSIHILLLQRNWQQPASQNDSEIPAYHSTELIARTGMMRCSVTLLPPLYAPQQVTLFHYQPVRLSSASSSALYPGLDSSRFHLEAPTLTVIPCSIALSTSSEEM